MAFYRGEQPPSLADTPVAPLHVLKQYRSQLRYSEDYGPRTSLRRSQSNMSKQTSASTCEELKQQAANLNEPLIQESKTTRPPALDNWQGLKEIFGDPLCVLLVCSPLGICAGVLGWGPSWTFWLNFAALIPLAKLLGDGTEEVAATIHNDTVSGLLNASFGNAVEMIVSVQALRNGLFSIVKTSLMGSILSNVLLVLGTSFLCGGLSHRTENKHTSFAVAPSANDIVAHEKEQTFGRKSALMSMGMLLFSCMSFALPTIFDKSPGNDHEKVIRVSRLGALIVMSTYIAFLVFQLITHKTMMQQDDGQGDVKPVSLAIPDESQPLGPNGSAATGDEEDEEDEEEAAKVSLLVALLLMAISTVVVAINSEFLVDALEAVVRSTGIPESFIGVILLPIAGNACEHAGAIRFAILDRPGLSIGIAVGSSTQIALLVIPFSVLVGWAMGEGMDLNFGALNTAVMVLSVLVVLALILDGTSNWLKGYIMVAMYVFIAILYWFVPPPSGNDSYAH